MIICKRPAHPDDHLEVAGLSGRPFAFVVRHCLFMVIVCGLSFVIVCHCLLLFAVCRRRRAVLT